MHAWALAGRTSWRPIAPLRCWRGLQGWMSTGLDYNQPSQRFLSKNKLDRGDVQWRVVACARLGGRARDDKVARDAAPVALAVLLQAQQEQSVLVLGPRDALAPLLVALSLCLRVRTRWCWTRLSCDPPQAQDRERPNGVLVLFVESSLAQPSQRRHCAFSERRCKSANRGEERQCAPQWW